MPSTELATINRLETAILKAKDLASVVDIRDKAELMRQRVRQVRGGLRIQNEAAGLKILCEWRAGQILAGTIKRGGDRRSKFHDGTLKLDDLGIDKKESHRWQRLHDLCEISYITQVRDEMTAGGAELTTAAFLRELLRDQERPEAPPLPEGVYQVILADPPWEYRDKMVVGYGSAAHHYPTMSVEELCNLKVKNISARDAVLFLWTTAPLLADAFPVIEAWGFAYKTCFIWDKQAHNFGHYCSVRHELLLLATRGQFTPSGKELEPSVVACKRTTRHSEKPEQFRKMIERMYPKTAKRRLELFSRKKVSGWVSWGNEA